jgi:hypothetical protein
MMAQRTPFDSRDTSHEGEAALDEVTATFVPRTELGRRLLELRAKAVRAGMPLLSREELEREIAERRGGVEWIEYQERSSE